MSAARRSTTTSSIPTTRGTLSWEEVECLGACVNAPMVMIFKDTYEDLTPERLAEIIEAFEAGKGDTVKPGPQNGRSFSAPVSGPDQPQGRDGDPEVGSVGECRVAAAEAAAATAVVPPSEAARPKTDAAETSPALKTPSPEKAQPERPRKPQASRRRRIRPRPPTRLRRRSRRSRSSERRERRADEPVAAFKAPEAEAERRIRDQEACREAVAGRQEPSGRRSKSPRQSTISS